MGIVNYDSLETVIANTVEIALMTNPDPRCIGKQNKLIVEQKKRKQFNKTITNQNKLENSFICCVECCDCVNVEG